MAGSGMTTRKEPTVKVNKRWLDGVIQADDDYKAVLAAVKDLADSIERVMKSVQTVTSTHRMILNALKDKL